MSNLPPLMLDSARPVSLSRTGTARGAPTRRAREQANRHTSFTLNRMTEFSIIAVFFAGLLGGVHVLGMCGSIVGVLTAQLPKTATRWPFHLAYNAGRLASYAVAGALAGAARHAALLCRAQGA